jgi:ATP phosphoribosyltransferase regulatory subunit
MNDAQLYKLPQGTERLVLDEAFRRQVLTHRVQDLFTSWGYQPVQTPVFDFYDLYAPFLGAKAESVYRLVDREGDLLVLRSDITLFLARSMGVVLTQGHQPLRVCYADTILRHQDLEDISANEFYQIGAEFIGSKGPDDDLELLLLLDDILNLLGLNDARIHLGSRALFDAAFGALSSEDRRTLLESVSLRRWASVGSLATLFAYQGDSAGVLALAASLPDLSEAVKFELTALAARAATLETLGLQHRFRVDLSEVGRHDYYTGLVFQVYQPGLGDALATGGRYDKLLARFGLDSPSVGFSLHLGKVEHLVDLGPLAAPSAAKPAPGTTLAERVKNARRLRAEGRNVTL